MKIITLLFFATVMISCASLLVALEVSNRTEIDLQYTIELADTTGHLELTSTVRPGQDHVHNAFPIRTSVHDTHYCKISFSGGTSFAKSYQMTIESFKQIAFIFQTNWDGEYVFAQCYANRSIVE